MTVKTAKERPGLAGMEAFFVIDQNRSSANWPLAKTLQRHGDAETGFKRDVKCSVRSGTLSSAAEGRHLPPGAPMRAVSKPPQWGHTAEPRASKMRELRKEAGRAAKADMDAARER
jgi:hypothetical protein